LIFKSFSVFYLRIAIMITIEKLIRIDQGSIFVLQSIRDFFRKIDPCFRFDVTLLGTLPPPRGHPPHCESDVSPSEGLS